MKYILYYLPNNDDLFGASEVRTLTSRHIQTKSDIERSTCHISSWKKITVNFGNKLQT